MGVPLVSRTTSLYSPVSPILILSLTSLSLTSPPLTVLDIHARSACNVVQSIVSTSTCVTSCQPPQYLHCQGAVSHQAESARKRWSEYAYCQIKLSGNARIHRSVLYLYHTQNSAVGRSNLLAIMCNFSSRSQAQFTHPQPPGQLLATTSRSEAMAPLVNSTTESALAQIVVVQHRSMTTTLVTTLPSQI